MREGDLVLVDAGVEVDSLYTADITRTLPVNGRFTEVQARVYQAVLDACEAALARANEPGCRFKDVHDAAMKVIAARLHEWGILPVTPEELPGTRGPAAPSLDAARHQPPPGPGRARLRAGKG